MNRTARLSMLNLIQNEEAMITYFEICRETTDVEGLKKVYSDIIELHKRLLANHIDTFDELLKED